MRVSTYPVDAVRLIDRRFLFFLLSLFQLWVWLHRGAQQWNVDKRSVLYSVHSSDSPNQLRSPFSHYTESHRRQGLACMTIFLFQTLFTSFLFYSVHQSCLLFVIFCHRLSKVFFHVVFFNFLFSPLLFTLSSVPSNWMTMSEVQ